MTTTIGARVREIRRRKNLSQAQLVHGLSLSVSYVSLIESGRRRPSREVLDALAERLGCSVDYLLTGRGGPDADALTLEMRFAELALRSGDAAVAHQRYEQVAQRFDELGCEDERLEAQWGLARAAEALGRLDEAILRLEDLVAAPRLPATMSRAAVVAALCLACLHAGDLSRAVEIGEETLRAGWGSDADPLDRDKRIELASTLIACYYRRGDLTHAHLLAGATMRRAEGTGSTAGRAAIVAEARGEAAAARALTERALALYGETDNARAVSTLRTNCAWLILRSPDPDLTEAERLLQRALEELPDVGSPVDVATAEIELARCRLLAGDPIGAREIAAAAVDRLGGVPRIESVHARLVLAAARSALGEVDGAVAAYAEAAADLAGTQPNPEVVGAWRELAEGLAGLGRLDEAMRAYRCLADAAGVPGTPVRFGWATAGARQ
jgi:transcriptional regulator with XRE-family HTH domain